MTELGRWLRAQRQERGWNVPEMTRRLRRAAAESGDKLPAGECLWTMIRRWERGGTGVSERYRLHYCRAFGIEPGQFGPPGWAPATARPGGAVTAAPAWPAVLGEMRDSFAEDAKTCQARADQAGDTIRAALCRGQALAYTAAAENLAAVLAACPGPAQRSAS